MKNNFMRENNQSLALSKSEKDSFTSEKRPQYLKINHQLKKPSRKSSYLSFRCSTQQQPLSPTSLRPKSNAMLKKNIFEPLQKSYRQLKKMIKTNKIDFKEFFEKLDKIFNNFVSKASEKQSDKKKSETLSQLSYVKSEVRQVLYQRSNQEFDKNSFYFASENTIKIDQIYENKINQKNKLIFQYEKIIQQQKILFLKQKEEKIKRIDIWEQQKNKMKLDMQKLNIFISKMMIQKKQYEQKQYNMKKQLQKLSKLKTLVEKLKRQLKTMEKKNQQTQKLKQVQTSFKTKKNIGTVCKESSGQKLKQNIQLKRLLLELQNKTQAQDQEIITLENQVQQLKLKLNEKKAKESQILSAKSSIQTGAYSYSSNKSFLDNQIINIKKINKQLISSNVDLEIQVTHLKKSLTNSKLAFSDLLQRVSEIQTVHQSFLSKSNFNGVHNDCIREINELKQQLKLIKYEKINSKNFEMR